MSTVAFPASNPTDYKTMDMRNVSYWTARATEYATKLRNGVAPWQREAIKSDTPLPYDPLKPGKLPTDQHRVYEGFAAFHLIDAYRRSPDSGGRFSLGTEMDARGMRLRSGAAPQTVDIASILTVDLKETKEPGSNIAKREFIKRIPPITIERTYAAWANLEMSPPIPNLPKPAAPDVESDILRMAQEGGVTLKHDANTSTFYDRNSHTLHMRPKEKYLDNFKDGEKAYQFDLLSNVVDAVVHKNKYFLEGKSPVGTEYLTVGQHLRSEQASALLAYRYGLGEQERARPLTVIEKEDREQTIAIRRERAREQADHIREHPHELFKAGLDAQGLSEYLHLGKDLHKELQQARQKTNEEKILSKIVDQPKTPNIQMTTMRYGGGRDERS